MHLASFNLTYYKYNTHKSKVCKFGFLRPLLSNLAININGIIWLKQDNIWLNPWNPTIASLIQFNHDVNFSPSNIKVLAFIIYITNYATKSDYSQYQRVMVIAIVRKAFNNYDYKIMTDPSNYTPTLNKFLLKVFNQLSHNREINRPLVVSYLLNLLNYYYLKTIVKIINITLL